MKIRFSDYRVLEEQIPDEMSVLDAKLFLKNLLDVVETLESPEIVKLHRNGNGNGKNGKTIEPEIKIRKKYKKWKKYKQRGTYTKRIPIKKYRRLTREEAIELFKIYYSPKSMGERSKLLEQKGVTYKSFQGKTTPLKSKWMITPQDLGLTEFPNAKNNPHKRTIPKTEEEIQERANKMEEIQQQTNDKQEEQKSEEKPKEISPNKDFTEEFDKW